MKIVVNKPLVILLVGLLWHKQSNMKYPKFLSVGNWLFMHLSKDGFADCTVGGPIPENLYIVYSSYKAPDLSKDLRTYEGLIAYGATEPDDKELLRLIKY